MGSTAHIAKGGRYVREYHSSFYGFANDEEGNRYTIGVLVIRPRDPHNFYASRSAVPVFREVVEALEEEHFLYSSQEAVYS
jgi:cell division protein FtsI (penicillin-binding protein 3)